MAEDFNQPEEQLVPEEPEDVVVVEREERPGPLERFWRAFKNFAVLFSFIVNFVLVVVVLLLLLTAPEPVFTAKRQVVEPLLTDLDSAFAALGDTTIETTVFIEHMLPIAFNLPLDKQTNVVLTEPVPLQVPATFYLPAGGGSINGTVSLQLPQGLELPVALAFDVPVEADIPVIMEVPVEIALSEAGMGPAIEQLRTVFRPLADYVQSLPDTTEEALQLGDE